MTEDFKNQLESFFDETYTNDIESLKKQKKEYDFLIQNLINELNIIETNQKSLKGTKLDVDKFSAYLKTLIIQNTSNTELLNNKVKEPSRSVELTSLKEYLDLILELITSANTEIQKHNNIVTNFNTEKKSLISSIWKFIVEKNKTDITTFNYQKNGFEIGINSLKTKIEAKIKEYKDLALK